MASCGECRFFRAHTEPPEGWLGDCRHQPQRGDFGPTAPICISFLSRNAPIPTALPEQPTRHRSRTLRGRVEPILIRRHAAEPEAAVPASNADLGEVLDMTSQEL